MSALCRQFHRHSETALSAGRGIHIHERRAMDSGLAACGRAPE
jgi:hypothetical protein